LPVISDEAFDDPEFTLSVFAETQYDFDGGERYFSYDSDANKISKIGAEIPPG
jgi:hypothetical protein